MVMNIKDIINKYPVTNGKWVTNNMLFTKTLYEYIQHIVKKDVSFGYLFHHNEYDSVTEFFLRFNYDDNRENSDPWGRQFKAYRTGYQTVKIDDYESRAIVDVTNKPKMYVTTTSVEGVMVYCVDVMTEVL